MRDKTIGFIGQGWIGMNYANDFENRGFKVVRYSLEPQFINNKELIQTCEIVFIAVPTPTTPTGFDISFVKSALSIVKPGTIAVVKSTMLPGMTEELQATYPELYVVHSPEFLVEKTAAYDAANPTRNIIGLPIENEIYREKAQIVLSVLPKAPFEMVCSAKEAELIKYGANVFLTMKVVYSNILYELSSKIGCDYEKVKAMVGADPRIGLSHMSVSDDGGRGAGGHCFIKDFEAYIELYKKYLTETEGLMMLESIRDKNVKLLRESGKNLDLLQGVYGA